MQESNRSNLSLMIRSFILSDVCTWANTCKHKKLAKLRFYYSLWYAYKHSPTEYKNLCKRKDTQSQVDWVTKFK